MRPKFQKQSALKFDGRIIPLKAAEVMRLQYNKRSEVRLASRINETQILQTQCSNIC
jgi:hypothetical protein